MMILKKWLPASYRDNFYREREGDGMYIKKADIKYPVYVKDNYVAIEIDGKAYKLEDIEF